MKARAKKANGHMRTKFNNCIRLYLILTAYDPIRRKCGNIQIVNLLIRDYKCGKFQGMKMRCSHVVVAFKHLHIDFWQYINKCYTLDETLKCYHTPFQPLAHESYWPQQFGPMIVQIQK